MMSGVFYIGRVKVLLHGRGEGAVSYEEKGTWVYLVTSAGSALKLVAYRRGV
jgi:hypothetical protein